MTPVKRNPIDIALQSAVPTEMVPISGDLMALQSPGMRFLVAKDGLWIEAALPWIHLRYPVATQRAMVLPYGVVTHHMDFRFGPAPAAFIRKFREHAAAASPSEICAWITWKAECGFRYRALERSAPQPDGLIVFEAALLAEDEHVVFDLHSRGNLRAGFTEQDDFHNSGAFIKIDGVFGSCDREEMDASFRLCVNGLFIDLLDAFDAVVA